MGQGKLRTSLLDVTMYLWSLENYGDVLTKMGACEHHN